MCPLLCPRANFQLSLCIRTCCKKNNCKGKWIYDQAELDHITYLGGEKQKKQAACQNSNYLKDRMPRRNCRCSSPCTAVQGQGGRDRLPSSQAPVTTGSVKGSRIDVRGNPTHTAIKPKVTTFNNTSCYIRPNYQQANSL